MKRSILLAIAAGLLSATALSAAEPLNFNRVSVFPVIRNLPAGADPKEETVSEIIATNAEGTLLVYTDSPGGRIGLVDITDAAAPKPAGTVALDGEPTSVVVAGNKAFVAVNTSKSYKEPSGFLAVVDLAGKTVEKKIDLGGQPDSVALGRDGKSLAIAIENERDEDLDDGKLPQAPAGFLVLASVGEGGGVDEASVRRVELTGIAAYAPEDPEPEFVDFNDKGEVVVTLQENNHLVIVDFETGKVVSHFPAGDVTLENVDTKRDGVINPVDRVENVPREPDAVRWIDNDRFVTANEGDYKGGARGFTIFNRDGSVAFESNSAFEHELVRIGHYPEKRNSKGVEPEGIAFAKFGDDNLIFVGSERGSVIGVYRDEGPGKEPTFLQVLPGGGIGPEGLLAIPQRDLFVVANETDRREKGGQGTTVAIFKRDETPAAYPTLASGNNDAGIPIGWGALSGAVADPEVPGRLYVVSDSFYSQGAIYVVDATQSPARIIEQIVVTENGKPAADLDLEGIAVRPDGGFWLASEGNPEREKNPTHSKLVRVDAKGEVQEIVELPDELKHHATRYGFEGVAVGGQGDEETLWIAVQREWKDDPKGHAKILAYTPADKSWGALHYPLDTPANGWVGLSEITYIGDDTFIVIERDNQIGDDAQIKKLYRFSVKDLKPAAVGEKEIAVIDKTLVRDLLPDLAATNGVILEKIESFAIDKAGNSYIITDNDGVDGSSGETLFLNLGNISLR
ncbi:esterase-like activity of phytase family protein [Pseudochelatococcus contaminans]|uniref:Uncharacterized protein YjiK n=1 Tax=Pseudochelatococcus contaminans TaxID=1538103 RepID=A0A7W5Z4K8_9HYPH|nr:esterase-like activity of phytase family protein [Pseudochelatococcus contaminans]MBB3809604.1 uncharacterized protein YjiK [Pseudochelatococcus contaminans]